jgi:formylglycine-generating enzyme required for sulfatase activity
VPQLLARLLHLALLAALLLGHQGFAQVSDGKGLTPLEGVVPIPDDRALWDSVKDSRDVNDFKAYLNKFPKGLFADVAANRIRALGGANPAPLVQSAPAQPVPRAGQTIKDCADCPEMVVLPAGSFEMGSYDDADSRPVHRVNIAGFLLGKTEVTQGQWRAVMGSNPSSFSSCGDDCPVERVSWDDAKHFAQRLSQKTGNQYRLPSEAEWEYAARAGSSTKWSFGDVEYQIGDYAWFGANSQYKTQRVEQKRPNAFGLFDMHGNVWEWVEDCWHGSYSGAPTDGSAWTTGCNGKGRVLRGGSWVNAPAGLLSAGRFKYAPDYGGGSFGLRLARTPDAASELANKAEQERRAAEEAQKAAEHQRLVMVAQANEQVHLAELVDRERTAREAAVQEQARAATAPAQRPAAARLAELPQPGQIIKDCVGCPEMVLIPAGSFTMGSSAAEQSLANSGGVPANLTGRENPQHRVNIRSFAAGRYAISKGEFATFVRAKGYQTEAERGGGCLAWNGKEWKKDAAYNWRNVGFAQADNHPVVCVSWNDAQAYIAWLNQSSGQTYRLLSEAEREYAARGGTQTAFWWGDSINTAQGNYEGTGPSYNGSPKGKHRQATVPVNSFSPNPFGLYNVHGNVWEWVEDCWSENYSGAPTDGSAWTTGDCRYRVLRGGSWNYYPTVLRSAFRNRLTPDNSGNYFGLRLARTP